MAINTDYRGFTNQKQWKQYIRYLLLTNDEALKRAILIVYNNQTQEEKEVSQSIQENKIGFGKVDVEFLSGIARKLLNKKGLTENELSKSRAKMLKYWKQIMTFSKKRLENQKREESEYQETMEQNTQIMEAKDEQDEVAFQMRLYCYTNGEPCSYGICDECPFEC